MKPVRIVPIMATICILAIVLSGCLSVEMKNYQFTLNEDDSGSGKIEFINIVSEEDSDTDVSEADFAELVDNYLEGTTFEEENPNFAIVEKHIYEQDGQLNGEVIFTFQSLEAAGFYRDPNCKCSQTLYYFSAINENLTETNGKYLGENIDFPIIAWEPDIKELYFTTSIGDQSVVSHSLLENYKSWLENK